MYDSHQFGQITTTLLEINHRHVLSTYTFLKIFFKLWLRTIVCISTFLHGCTTYHDTIVSRTQIIDTVFIMLLPLYMWPLRSCVYSRQSVALEVVYIY